MFFNALHKQFIGKLRFLMSAGVVCLCFCVFSFLILNVHTSWAQSAFENPSSRGATANGGLIPVEVSVDGGTIGIGSSAEIVVLFRNESGTPLNVGAITLYASSNVAGNVTFNQCAEEAIPSGADCAIAVSVKGLQAGPWRVPILMRHNGRSKLVSASVYGVVEGNAEGNDKIINDVEAIPSELDFETIESSSAQLRSVTLRNITSNEIKISDIYLKSETSSGLSIESECDSLKAGQACLIAVKWSPKQRGVASGVLVVKHGGPTGITTVSIEGDYTPEGSEEAEIFPEAVPGQGLLLSSLSEIDFGESIDSISAITTSLVNAGDAPLSFRDLSLSGSENGLEIESEGDGCAMDTVLAPMEACPLTLSWAPVRAGMLLDDVKIKHSGSRGVLVLPVRGTALNSVSKDSQSIVLNSPGFVLDPTSDSDSALDARSSSDLSVSYGIDGDTATKVKALDGYMITSIGSDRAIITSPRGSRVIFNQEPMVLAGVTWVPRVQYNGVEFESGEDKVLMMFDRSLSSVNSFGTISSGNNSNVSDTSSDSIEN